MKVWIETLGIVGGMLLAVIGILLILVSGLDPLFSLLGLVLFVGGGILLVRIRRANPVQTNETTVTSGRAVQRPLTPEEQKKSGFRGKI